jgi:hypothetical protein
MFQNYLITALRNFTRHKLYSFINIAGLTVGLSCAIFIILLLRDELSYDKWIPGSENLYRVGFTFYLPGQRPVRVSYAPFPAPGVMLANIPEVKAIAHLEPQRLTMTVGDRQFDEQMDVVSPDFFRVIGLRKTFGAKTRDIVLLLLWQFSIPVLAANLIAWPVAYYYLRGWLEGYAYRIPLSPLYFIGAGAAALMIAWATVFVHAQRVARANPIHALRYE